MAKAKAAKVVTEKLDLSKYPKLFAAGMCCIVLSDC